jgi:hypothetical protein
VGTNAILVECKFLWKNAHRTSALLVWPVI